MGKQQQYNALVKDRKNCRLCENRYGMRNPAIIADGRYDQAVAIGPWSMWQGSLEAKILVVGQDWGDEAAYLLDEGKSGLDDNVTDMNLIELFKTMGIAVAHPRDGKQNPLLFFTNAVLCMKSGGLAAKIPNPVYTACANEFLKRLIEVIRPRIIITLGSKAYQRVTRLYGQELVQFTTLMNLIKDGYGPLIMPEKDELPAVVFLPAPQCGQYSTNTFMDLDNQKRIWSRLKKHI
ncbi:MAG: uracil-DNA glycosylase family protein [Syntrophomonadaceae bacterium]